MNSTSAPRLDPAKFPRLSGVERPFFEFWWNHVSSPEDPQRLRWLEREEQLVDIAGAWADNLGTKLDLHGARVLDVGCQNGATLVALAKRGAKPSGIEIDSKAAQAAVIRMRCYGFESSVVTGSACDMPYPAESFDSVLASNLTEHVADTDALVRECARVLGKGGILYIDGPNRYSPRLFLRDPHYRLFGVSALPGPWACWYIAKVRKLPVDYLATFPTSSSIRSKLGRFGMGVLDEPGKPDASPFPRVIMNLRSSFTFLAEKR